MVSLQESDLANFVANTYDIGDVVRCRAIFTDSDSVAVDPAAVVFKFKAPGSAIVTYTYGVDGQILKTSTGNYYVDLTIATAGTYRYRFAATGSGASAGEKTFLVSESAFV